MSSSDFNKPITSDNYVNIPTEIKSTAIDLALGLDPATTSPANTPVNAIRWNSANSYWEKFSGSAWSALTATYAIVVSQAIKLKNAFALNISGDITGSVNIDGSGPVTLISTLTSVNSNVGGFGSSVTVPSFTVDAKGRITSASGVAINVISALGYTPYNSTNPSGYQTSAGSVSYATSSGSASSASTVPWSGVSGKPSVTTWNWAWSGQGGQPTWLWGGSDGVNFYVYNPANFSVNYANSAGSAGYAASAGSAGNGGVTSVNGQTGAVTVTSPTYTSQLTNNSGFITAAANVASANYAGSAGNGISSVSSWSFYSGTTTYNYQRITISNGNYFDTFISSVNTAGGGGG